MWPDRVSNPGPLTYESGALPIALRGPASPSQVTAPISGHDDKEVDNFYRQFQEIIDQNPKKDILVVQEDWNAKVEKDAPADWGDTCDHSSILRQIREISVF